MQDRISFGGSNFSYIFKCCSSIILFIGRPPGSFALCESEASATKRPVGTEINPMLW
ncbi:hypothetical protein [Lysinibacillus sp. fls2-241-R2A-57]|uniref:hypothetical protein n=1 Tax=Lysinibacillus sp. fls2-241-R2A-57 TaxID=3040292 RepID=UPI002557276B|nr:hypothetical protein [Lysinibacillus sp. fls2-241-R2A-57]